MAGTHDDTHEDTDDGTRPAVAGLLLAAGGGRRLGGRPKALLEHRGRPLVEHAARTLREGGCARVHVVLGAAAEQVRGRAELPDCVLVDNPRWADGMGSSLRAGLASLAGTDVRAALVLLVDQPGIGAAAVARLVAAYRASTGLASPSDPPTSASDPPTSASDARTSVSDALVSASYDGKRGHPVLLGAGHWAGIAADATADRGARDYLKARESDIVLVECGDVARPYDIDTEEDLSHLE
ncbi:NTP transferase domain-containing protein [Streptomyces sp. NPDC088116]|uniref:nucleotidyltransferase family protein n=1 Tax=Streptomyces sp. NPDC088116 TaxID=3365825 RepID=UPI003828CC81